MSRPWLFKLRSSSAFTLAVVCLGLFTENLTYCTIIPILPLALINRAGVPEDDVQYYISFLLASYAVVFFISAPIFGYLTDRLSSRRLPYMWGILANIVALILYMMADSFTTMTLARILQGVSSAAVNVVGMSLIKDTVKKNQIGKGMAYTGAATQAGLVLGPSIGGFLYDNTGYEAVFIIPAVLLAIDLCMRFMMIEKPGIELKHSSSGGQHESDANQPPEYSESDSTEETSLLNKTRDDQDLYDRLPIIDLVFRGRMLTTLLVTILNVVIWTGLESTVPLFVFRTFEWTASQAGLLFFATCIPNILLSPIMGKAIDRLGSLVPSVICISIAAVCFITQRIVHENTLHDKITHVALFTLSNFCMFVVAITMSAEIGLNAHDVDEERVRKGKSGGMVGKSYALSMMACSGGQFLGPLIGGVMVQKTGWAGMTLLFGSSLIFAIPAMISFTGGGILALRKRYQELRETDIGAC